MTGPTGLIPVEAGLSRRAFVHVSQRDADGRGIREGCVPLLPLRKQCQTFNSPREFKPYPLLQRYLRRQIVAIGDHLQLVVIDATSPNEPNVQTASMETVLEAQESRTTHLETAYQLRLEQGTDAYRVQEIPE